MVALDCALPLYMKALVDDGVIDLAGLLAMMTINPARLLGIDRTGLGALAVGGPGAGSEVTAAGILNDIQSLADW